LTVNIYQIIGAAIVATITLTIIFVIYFWFVLAGIIEGVVAFNIDYFVINVEKCKNYWFRLLQKQKSIEKSWKH
jgi:hypothetical protein